MSIRNCMSAVAKVFNVSVVEMCSRRRATYVSHPRQAAMLLARWEGFSFARIGRAFGGRDHSTARSACQAATIRADVDEEYGDLLQAAWIGLKWAVSRHAVIRDRVGMKARTP